VDGFDALDAKWLDDGTDRHETSYRRTAYCSGGQTAQQRKSPQPVGMWAKGQALKSFT
jgi:hypothetical protein